MDSAVLALAAFAAICWGSQNYVGSIISREISPSRAVLAVQAMSFIFVTPVALIGWGSLTTTAIGWGTAAALVGACGSVFTYCASAVGQIAVTRKVSSGVAAVLPFAVGVAAGFRPTPITVLGLAFIVVALLLLSTQRMNSSPDGVQYQRARALAFSFAAGVGLGGALIALGQTSIDDGLYPFVFYRLVATALLAAFILVRRQQLLPPRHLFGPVALTALLSTLGDITVMLALQQGSYSLVPAVTSLNPGVTALLARWLAHERLRRLQVVAILVGLLGLSLFQL